MRKIIPVIAAGATGLLIAGGAFAYASVDKGVTLSVDGRQSTEQTYASTVGDFLADEGIAVGERDVVAPGLDTKLDDGTRVTVLYGREVNVTVDGKKHSFWTTATNVDSALAGLNVKLDGADISTSRSTSIGREGIALAVATEKKVNLTNAGKKQTVRTTGRSVADVLKAAKVSVDSNDKVTPSVKAAIVDGAKVSYVRVDVKSKTKKTDIDYQTRQTYTSNLTKGTTKVETEGRDGETTTKYTETYENGKLVKTVKGSSKTTVQPVTKVVLIGTKVIAPKPVARPKPSTSSGKPSTSSGKPSTSSGSGSSSSSSSSTSGSSSPKSPAVPSGSVWDRLAQCESGGNWAINTGNGFYGGLQFTLSTWRGYGGSGMPHQASREAQIAVATKVQKAQGWGAWPACTAKLGIR